MNVIKRPLFAVFDTETTGLPKHPQAKLSEQPKTIEFAGIITDGIEIIDQIEFICNPGQAIDEVITKITGLTNADLDKCESFTHFIPAVRNYFSQADVAVAHNLSFDRSIMKFEMDRIGETLDHIKFPKRLCCTVEQTSSIYGYDRKLSDLYNELIGSYVQKHRALDDILLLHKVAKHIGIYQAFGGL